MSGIDVNDLKSRIDILYHVTDVYVERTAVAPLSVEQQVNTDAEGNETFTISFGGGEMSPKETLQARSTILSIISEIANLKDNLKNKMDMEGKNSKLVEQEIDSSSHLSAIVDLNNSVKHGYPLKKYKRTNYDPRIANIRKEMGVPLTPGKFTNVFSESVVTFEADVVNKTGDLVHDFRDLTESALSAFEDFCIINLPNDSGEILARRDKIKRKSEWQLDHFSRGKDVEKIISNPNNWHEIIGQQVQAGMVVKATGFQENAATLMGFPSEASETIASKDTIRMFDVTFGNQVNLGKKSNKWELLVVDKQSDLKLVNDYYWEMFNPPDFS